MNRWLFFIGLGPPSRRGTQVKRLYCKVGRKQVSDIVFLIKKNG